MILHFFFFYFFFNVQKVSGYGYGDHYIHIKIAGPDKLTVQQRALLQAYAEIEPNTPGTITGFTYNKAGNRVLMEEDSEGLVSEIREALKTKKDKKVVESDKKEEDLEEKPSQEESQEKA